MARNAKNLDIYKCLSCICNALGDAFCWVLQCKFLWGAMAYLKKKPPRGAPYEWWALSGPIPRDEDDDEELTLLGSSADEFGWGNVGRVSISFELVPQALAELRPVGEGRAAPNQFPFLHPPERETFSLLNPLGTLKTLVGGDIFARLAALICCGVCFFLTALMLPMLFSGGASIAIFLPAAAVAPVVSAALRLTFSVAYTVITKLIEKCCLPG